MSGLTSGATKDAQEFLRALPFDAELAPGARNAVEQCLRIQPDEKVTLITDHACAEIGSAPGYTGSRFAAVRRYPAHSMETPRAGPEYA